MLVWKNSKGRQVATEPAGMGLRHLGGGPNTSELPV